MVVCQTFLSAPDKEHRDVQYLEISQTFQKTKQFITKPSQHLLISKPLLRGAYVYLSIPDLHILF